MEYKGEFTCEVHTRNMSGCTTVLLQGVGFAALHIAILVLCSVALLLAVGFCGPVCILLRKKVASKEGMKWHIFLILCPNICMFLSFCLWSSEGFLSEVIICSTVSIMRPVILMKTSSYLGMLPERIQKTVKALAVPLYHLTISTAACSISSGYLALMPLVHVLAAICLFKHPKYLPDFLHVMIYMFGAVGLSTLNAIVLATELILKAGIKFKDRTKCHFEDERRTGPEIVQEMEALKVPNPNSGSSEVVRSNFLNLLQDQ
ncbi:hypothetical protein KOW79_002860 [Hemibagrus wyckioides]|uniref:Uncharacterized protein n=1 Tax=Hemibagrus wyckioides TaxID=337641 RepID=A0A9D3P7T9_9TELE|nr:hypothetical protein KOW79_002860 [Hemibagrus wyckioides]